MHSHGKSLAWTLTIVMALTLAFALAGVPMARADQAISRSAAVELNVGDSLVVRSDHLAIQKVFVEGNLSAAQVERASQYPTNTFQFGAMSPGTYSLQVFFNQTSDYTVNLYVRQNGTNVINNSTSYYISGGSFELDVTAFFDPSPGGAAAQASSLSAWDSLANWMGNFGQAFPLWVKALYLVFGVQFFTVGGLWIRRESAKKEAATQRLDAGDKAYLWLDITYKFLLASFVAIVAIMAGELMILFVLRFMFLVSINLLSLWDLFVVGFAAGAVIMVYLVRFVLERAFDLKPVEDE
jgi:hypothetical protein